MRVYKIISNLKMIWRNTYNSKLKNHAKNLPCNMTKQEIVLWAKLRKRQVYGIKFLRQSPVLNYILDFYSQEVRLAIEIDGSQHYDDLNTQKDNLRDHQLLQMGIKTLRYSNSNINTKLELVLEDIYLQVQSRM